MRPKLIKPRGPGAGERTAGERLAGTGMTDSATASGGSGALATRTAATEPGPGGLPSRAGGSVDLERRREQLTARVAELQWDLGGLVYEMAIRDRIRVDVLVRRAAVLQNADAELSEVERILRLEQSSTAGECAS